MVFAGLNTLNAQNGEELFKKSCSPCHTIGGGKLVGPDLINITEKRERQWLIDFTKSSTKMINSGNPDAVAIFNEYLKMPMPDQSLSEPEINSVFDFIASKGKVEVSGQAVTQEEFIDKASKEDIKNGFLLFTGERKLTNKGASCISCHDIIDKRVKFGGNMAKELTQSYNNLKAAGIKAILSSLPFPAMTDSYKKSPLTEKEIHDLTAYLKSAGNKTGKPGLSSFSGQFIMYGVLLFLSINLIIALYWNTGKIKSTNFEITKRQKKSL